jgi:hypothetical protein
LLNNLVYLNKNTTNAEPKAIANVSNVNNLGLVTGKTISPTQHPAPTPNKTNKTNIVIIKHVNIGG